MLPRDVYYASIAYTIFPQRSLASQKRNRALSLQVILVHIALLSRKEDVK
jgi:hypothetical protein